MDSCPTCLTNIENGATICPACGQELCLSCFEPLAPGAVSCSACGSEAVMACSGCQRLISRTASYCTECGQTVAAIGPILVPEYTRIDRATDDSQDESFTGVCPTCSTDLYVQDGFCSECGQSLCTNCGHALDDEDDRCPACGVALFVLCPLCEFQLMAGTEMCPNCNALFPAVCSRCGEEMQPTDDHCPNCRRSVKIEPRQSARTIRTFLIGQQLVRMIACPGCGRHTNPAAGPCARCATWVCGECQLILLDDERYCPRCSHKIGTSTYPDLDTQGPFR